MKWRVLSALAVLVLAPLAVLAQQQEGLITGKVTSDAGAPIAGAQVFLEGMNIGTTTKDDGTYRFVIPAGRATGQKASLSVKLIGFKAKSVLIALKGGEQTMDFVLGAQAVVLQQVVVTGEGIITTNEKLGATVNTVGNTQIAQANETNVTNALSAKAPNVQIQSMSADPGSSTSIQIRGIKSLSGTGQPLFVVDGVPLDNSTISVEAATVGATANAAGPVAPNRISDVNPNDIESVTVLKGAAASAIYGARASQGVVIITTKSGKPGTTRYTFNSSYSANDVTQGYPLQTSYAQDGWIAPGSVGYNPANPTVACGDPDCTVASGRSWGVAIPTGTTVYDHFSEMFHTGSVWDNMLTVSGGDDRRTFYFSGGYAANNGIVVGGQNSYDRLTIKGHGTQLMGDRMKLGVNFSYVNTTGTFVQRGDNASGLMLGGTRTPAMFNNMQYLDSASGLQRSYRFPNPTTASLSTTRVFNNPIWVATSEPSTSTMNRVYGNMDFNWNPNDWLTVQWTPGVDYYADQRNEAFPFTDATYSAGLVNSAIYSNFIVSSVVTVVGTHTFSPSLSGTVTFGSELNSTNFTQSWVQGAGLIAPKPYKLTNTTSWFPIDDQTLIHNQSYFGQVTADLWDQLYVTAAIRNDGFSTFAQNNPRAWYPKASAAWTFTKEVSPGSWLQFGKLRAAYGETGKPPDPYTTLQTYTTNQYYEYGNVGYLNTVYFGAPGLASTTGLGTDSLRAERQKETEAGLDLGLFDGMMDFGFTYYNSRANDVIINLPLPPSSGAQSEPVNAMSISNKGYEVTFNVNSSPKSKDFAWTAGIIWSQNRNLVTSIKGASEVPLPNDASSPVARPGSPIGSFEGNDFVRCGQGARYNDVLIDAPGQVCDGKPKGALYIGLSGYPVVDDSLRIVGSYQPNWNAGIHGSFTFRQKLQLSFLVDVRNGGQAFNGTRGALYSYGTHKDTEDRGTVAAFGDANWWPGPVVGPGIGVPITIGSTWYKGLGSSFNGPAASFIENAGFTKLREVALAYTLDNEFVTHSLGLSSMIIRVAGRNLYTWTSYTGLDPETNLEGAGNLVQGADWFGNPQARSLIFSISLNK